MILNHLSIYLMAGTHPKEDSSISKTIADMSETNPADWQYKS